jgi:hypothetical protein
MIDVFINTQAPITDVPAFLAGLGDQRVKLRDGGPTQVWERHAGTWQRDERPGLTLFEDLCPQRIEFTAYRLDGVMADLVQDGMTLGLEDAEAADWFGLAESHRYKIEDGIGCSCNADHKGGVIEMAMAELDPVDFVNIVDPDSDLGRKVADWARDAVAAGANRLTAFISIKPTR